MQEAPKVQPPNSQGLGIGEVFLSSFAGMLTSKCLLNHTSDPRPRRNGQWFALMVIGLLYFLPEGRFFLEERRLGLHCWSLFFLVCRLLTLLILPRDPCEESPWLRYPGAHEFFRPEMHKRLTRFCGAGHGALEPDSRGMPRR